MSKNYALKAAKRELAGKGVARALRREDKIPGVVYGDGKESVKISLPSIPVNLEYNKGLMFTHLCDLDVGGEKHLVLARDIQLHPVKDRVEHVDFLRVNAKTKIKIDVPVHFINEDKSPGLKEKAVLNVVRHEIELFCSAIDIPEFIEVDLTGMETGDAVKISHAILPQGSSPTIKERDFTIATLQEPKAYVEEEITNPAAEGVESAAPAEGAEGAAPAAGDKKAESDKKPEGDKKKG
ncbi:MAG: 50S ribosomal protein L25/general stress protein Ctc [Alphaproteobacteria bacterium]